MCGVYDKKLDTETPVIFVSLRPEVSEDPHRLIGMLG